MMDITNLQNMKSNFYLAPLKYRGNVPMQSGPLKIESSQMCL